MALFDWRARLREAAIGLAIGVGGAVAIWFGLYASGFLPVLGFAQQRFDAAGQPEAGLEVGAAYMLFLQGQTVWLDYETLGDDLTVEIALSRGGRAIVPRKRPSGGSGGQVKLAGNGIGRLEFVVPETGLYHLTISPSYTRTINERATRPSYTVTWGATF